MEFNTYTQEDIFGKRVLMRCDLDVKVNEDGIVDQYHDLRLERIVPVVHQLFGYGAMQVVLIGHRGRPDHKDMSLSLAPIRDRLADLCVSEGLDEPITLIDDISVDPLAHKHEPIIMLENLRFWPEEKAGDSLFAEKLSLWGQVYINNAFGNSHRADASMSALPGIMDRAFAGPELIKEVSTLESFILEIKKPFMIVLGGAKISTKLPLIEALSSKADAILLGGGLANTVLKARGKEMGESLVEQEMLSDARDLSDSAIILPDDAVLAEGRAVSVDEIQPDEAMLDIGPEANTKFVQLIQEANTILWNGPMGKFEDSAFEKGTYEIARAIAQNQQARTLAGGGETVEVLEKLDLVDKIDFVSEGGGAMLTFLADGEMPGLGSVKI